MSSIVSVLCAIGFEFEKKLSETVHNYRVYIVTSLYCQSKNRVTKRKITILYIHFVPISFSHQVEPQASASKAFISSRWPRGKVKIKRQEGGVWKPCIVNTIVSPWS